jgi:hypothetical protein
MMKATVRAVTLAASLSAILILISCSTAPPGPQPGSPEYLWAAARETAAAGDYLKTTLHLDKLASGQSEYAPKAEAWLLVLTAGMAKGYSDLADSFEAGAKMNREQPLTFRNQAANYQRTAGRMSVQYAEAFQRFAKSKTDPVPLAFGLPKGSSEVPPHLLRVEKGMMPTPGDIEAAQTAAINRGILLTASRAAGAGDDAAKAGALLKDPNFTVPRATFMLAMANALYDDANLYTRKKLSDPSKLKMFTGLATEALKGVPESKETKELTKKIQALLKKEKP